MYSSALKVTPAYQTSYGRMYYHNEDSQAASVITCNWQALRRQLLDQWRRISSKELDKAGPNRRRIAMLIEQKYGVSYDMVENYLRNFERTMPLMAHQ